MRRVRWAQACRIIPTRYPAVTLFDRVADAADFEALYALEAMTNERVRDELGQVERVARGERHSTRVVFSPVCLVVVHVGWLSSQRRFRIRASQVYLAKRRR